MKNAKRRSGKTPCQNMLKKHESCVYGRYISSSKNKKEKYLETYVI